MSAWAVFFVALFVVFILNAAACGLCRAAALGDRLAPEPCMAGDGAQAPPGVLSSASADEFMRPWDLEADIDGLDWGPR